MVNLCRSQSPLTPELDFGPLGDEGFRPDSPEGLMRCPTCGQNTPDAWQKLWIQQMGGSQLRDPEPSVRETLPGPHVVEFDWMHCANEECGQLVVRGHDSYTEYDGAGYPGVRTESWIAHPKHRSRPVDALVPEEFAEPFREAT